MRKPGIPHGLGLWLTLGLLGATIGLWRFDAPDPAFAGYAEVRAAWQSSEAQLLDRHGAVIHELRVDAEGRRLAWTNLAEISPALIVAVIAAEDRRFYAHSGIDWRGIAGALWQNAFAGDKKRGASTITMQLAGLLSPELRGGAAGRSLAMKFRQMRAAWRLEQGWSKAQILEAYLNRVSFRGELQGIRAASRGLFHKNPDGLTAQESLILAALLRGPNAPAAVVARRGCGLGPRMEHEVDCAVLTRRVTDALSTAPRIEPTMTLAPHVARRLLRPGASQARSTLDADLQRQATETLQRHLYQLAADNVRDGALLVVENRTGEVIAYVGNTGHNPDAFYVDGVIAPRQAGSTLKPFLYGMALENRWLTAASLLADTPVNLETPTGMYVPQNYDREFRGWVSARSALAGSLNVPAVRTLMLVGVDTFVERLRRLGFTGLTEDGDFYGYSLALGSAEVTLWQLVNAYRTLANQGRAGDLHLEAAPGSPAKEILDPSAAFVIGDILADRGARGITFGLDNPLVLPFPASVKTGTSKDMRDNWCIGFSDRYTVGVWVGNFNGDPMHDVSGVSGAAPVWADVMRYLHRDLVHDAPALPAGVVARQVSFSPAIEPQRQEYFLSGTETSRIVLQEPAQTTPKIAYPAEGGIIALDPDIPGDLQRVSFAITPESGSASWRLDGQPLTLTDGRWQPRRGRHVLALRDAAGQVIDEVRFVVRGR